MKKTFANLINPVGIDEFFSEYWERKILHVKRNEPAYFDQFLDVPAIDEYLNRQDLSPATIRLVKDGIDVQQDELTVKEYLLSGTVKKTISTEKLFEGFSSGATVIINAAQQGIRSLSDACQWLEQELKIAVQSNIYITPPNSQGFLKHYDPHDILSLQLLGAKTWRILDSGENLPTKLNSLTKEPELVVEIIRTPGDFLYIPRGTVHEAFSSIEPTIHVNFSLKPRYGFHLLETLAMLAETEDVFFRRTIPHGYSVEGERKSYIEEFSKNFGKLLEKNTPEDLLARQLEKFVCDQQIDSPNRLAKLLALDRLSPKSVVSRQTGITYLVKKTNEETRIVFGNKTAVVPKFIEPEIFFQDEPFAVNDIKGMITTQGKVDLIKQFIKSGFIRVNKF